MVSCLKVESLRRSESVCVCAVRVCPSLTDFHTAVRLSRLRVPSPHCVVSPPVLKVSWLQLCGSLPGPLAAPPIPASDFVPTPCSCDDCSFEVLSEVWGAMPSALFFPLRFVLAVLDLL